MKFSETQLQFFQLLNRLKKFGWDTQFQVLKPPEYIALHIIADYHSEHPDTPGLYVSKFASSLHITLPAASKSLKHLEQQGWLRRTVDPENRRNTFISLTEAGRAILEQETAYCAQQSNRVFQRFGQENTSALLQGLNQLLDLAEEEFSKGR